MTLAFLCDAEDEEAVTDVNGKEDKRVVLRFHPALLPFKVAVLPLTKKQSGIAEALHEELSKYFMADYDVPEASASVTGDRMKRVHLSA